MKQGARVSVTTVSGTYRTGLLMADGAARLVIQGDDGFVHDWPRSAITSVRTLVRCGECGAEGDEQSISEHEEGHR